MLIVAWRHERRPSNISYSLGVPCVNRGRSSHTALRPAHRFGIAAQVRTALPLGPGNHSAYCGTAYVVGVKIVRDSGATRAFFEALLP
jgi:hypothetical protein